MGTPSTAYDAVAYPSALYPQTHPDRLATLATLFGLQPPKVEQARVLELGCGDGSNLIAMAFALPASRFLGIDLAAEPIARGQRVIDGLELKNLTLRQLDVLQAPPDLGTFDYIIAHGLFSWVPVEVREKVLALCRAHLSERGVAYISYNAYPGNHLRELARRMMRFHVQQFSEPQEQMRQARTLLKFVAEARPEPGHWQEVVRHEFARVQNYLDAAFYHDDLSPINQPFYFGEFMESAERHGLQFLAEADYHDPEYAGLTSEATALVRQVEQCGRIAREQYLDFIKGRSFRQTLLCHAERRLSGEPAAEHVSGLFAAADARPVKTDADLTGLALEEFQRDKTVIAIRHPVLKSALVLLGQAWPRRVPFQELLDSARACIRAAGSSAPETPEDDGRDLREFLLRGYGIGFVDLHAHAAQFVANVSARPAASRLARWQLEHGLGIASLRHQPLKIDDALGRELLRLLDGTRDRAALLAELSRLVESGATPLYRDGALVSDPQEAPVVLASQLEPSLLNLARLGLLAG